MRPFHEAWVVNKGEKEIGGSNLAFIKSSNYEDMVRYIKEFPFSEYVVAHVPSHGKFYIDSIPDPVKDTVLHGTPWELHIANLIRKYAKPDSTVLDLGANIGTHSLTMAHAVGPEGRVIVFEPQPKLFRELFMNMALNDISNILFYWAAVGERNGSIEICPTVPFCEAGTPLIRNAVFKNSDCYYEVIGGTGVFVDLITLDSLNLDNVSLIKIDVEYMENAVLDGAISTILKNKPVIIIEICGGWDYRTAPPDKVKQIDVTIKKLEILGYQVSNIALWDYLAIPL